MEDNLKLNISYRQILQMAIPISFAILVPQFNFLINSFFLSKLGPGFMGASGITGVYYLVFSVIGYGLNNGLQTLVSRRAGQDRSSEIGGLFIQSIYLTLMIAAFGIICTYGFAPAIFGNFTDPALAKQSTSFLFIRIWGLPFLYIYQMRNALLVGTNQSKLLIWGTLAETVSNVVLDYGLIFGNLGMPKLGFNGAAYASIMAEFIGMIVVLAIINAKGMDKRFKLFDNMQFNWQISKTIFIQSSPIILQYAISIISWEFFFILVSHDGMLALDVSQLMRLLFGFYGIFIWAFAATSSTMVSNLVGQGLSKRVMILVGRIAMLSAGSTLVVFIPVQLFTREILSLFNDDLAFLTMAIPVLRVVSVAILMMSVSTVCLNAVTGTGNTRINLMIEMITVVMYILYVYLVMEVFNMSIAWGWGSEWVYWTSIFIMSFAYLKSGKWNNARSRSI
ncbi:MAG: MATE family efflux transporter [Chitinophagaceae bacterium]|nr:MATE family efflux transporter [Chitinophagaceae bacterium]